MLFPRRNRSPGGNYHLDFGDINCLDFPYSFIINVYILNHMVHSACLNCLWLESLWLYSFMTCFICWTYVCDVHPQLSLAHFHCWQQSAEWAHLSLPLNACLGCFLSRLEVSSKLRPCPMYFGVPHETMLPSQGLLKKIQIQTKLSAYSLGHCGEVTILNLRDFT